MLLQDAHTHFFSRRFFELLASEAGAGAAELERAAAAGGIALPDPDPERHRERWLTGLDASGVARALCFASHPKEAEVVAEACSGSEGRLVGLTVLNLAAPEAGAFLETALASLGLSGVVLFPALHHYDLGDAALRPLLGRLADHNGLCVVHAGILKIKLRDLLGLPRVYDMAYANPLGIVPAANAFRSVRFVVPHFGAGFLRETLMLADQCENVLVDTSSSNAWRRTQVPAPTLTQVFQAALAVLGPSRILFGTDSSTFPRGYRRDVYEEQRQCLRQLKLPDDEQQLIFGGNLSGLLGPPPERA